MDLKQPKTVHLRCPKCGHDFAKNTNRIEEDYQNACIKLTNIKREIAAAKEAGLPKNAPKRKRLAALEADAIAQVVAIKKARSNMNREMEVQKYEIFKKLVKGVIGAEKTILLLKEAEEEMVYRDYDTAIQKYNRFDGA